VSINDIAIGGKVEKVGGGGHQVIKRWVKLKRLDMQEK
jgi:hypothetical protein